MNDEPAPEFTPIEELMDIPLSDLVEPQWLDLPEIDPQDLDLPTEYIQDLMQRGEVGEDLSIIDMDNSLLEGPEQLPIVEGEEPTQERDFDFGR